MCFFYYFFFFRQKTAYDIVSRDCSSDVCASDLPDVRIRLLARSYNPLIQLVRSGEIDLAFCSSPPADDVTLEFKELFKYNTVLMTPPGHDLLHRGPVGLEDIATFPLILTAPESQLRQRVEQAFKSQIGRASCRERV